METKKTKTVKRKRGYSVGGYHFPYHGWCKDMHNQNEEPVKDCEPVKSSDGTYRFDPCRIGDWPPGPQPGDWPIYPTITWPIFTIPNFPNYSQSDKSYIDKSDNKLNLDWQDELNKPFCEHRLPCGMCKLTGNPCPKANSTPTEDGIIY